LLNKYDKEPLVRLNLASIKLKELNTPEAYNNLKNILDGENNNMPINILKDCYNTCLTYCSHKIRSEGEEYYRKMLELYQTMHTKDLILDKGVMSPNQLKNMITIGCREEQFKWAEDMIDEYCPNVLEPIKKSVYDFNVGVIAFSQKNYELAHEKLNEVGDVNFTYKINVRLLILKCIYETASQYDERTEANLRATGNYFNNNESLSIDRRESYKNFTRILINIYRFRYGEGKMTLKRIKEELEEKVNVDKQWLREKIAGLEQ